MNQPAEMLVVTEAVPQPAAPPSGRIRLTLRRFVTNPSAIAGAFVLLAMILLAFVGPYLTHWSYSEPDYEAIRAAPSARHWWGTNAIGQDVYAQTVRGLQKSVIIGLLVAVCSTVVASAVGTAAGYFRGWTDRTLMFVVDLLLVLPSFLIISIVSPRLRSHGWIALVGMIALFGWMITARVVRSMTLSIAEREFVTAARFMGVRPARIIVRHVLPNIASFLIIDATIQAGAAVITETSLSYFGFGVQAPDVSLGTLIADGTGDAIGYPWMFFFAAGLLVVFVLAVNLVGDGLRDALDPTSGTGRPARRADDVPPPVPSISDVEAAVDGPAPILRVRDLHVTFRARRKPPAPAVRGIDLDLYPGEVLGLVGESGSGKSVTSLALLGLLPGNARVHGSIELAGQQIVGASDEAMSRLRGQRIGIVFQDPLTSFTPVYRIGDQIAEALRAHQDISRERARQRVVELLDLVGIPDPARRANAFPHEFSGGMRQRAMIAMAIANDPDVIVADEPTTALDVTIQAQILDVLRTAQRETSAALLLVSHDLGVIAGLADRVAVMYAGRIVELAPVDELFARPQMPYTLGLLGAVPRPDRVGQALVPIPGSPASPASVHGACSFAPRCPLVEDACRTAEPPLRGSATHQAACIKASSVAGRSPADIYSLPVLSVSSRVPAPPTVRAERPPVLEVQGLVKTFPLYRGTVVRRRTGSVYAVDGIDLDLRRGETLGLVGESGSGKTTALYELFRRQRPEAGTITLLGQRLGEPVRDHAAARRLAAGAQIVFQDPMSSLDPRMPVGDIIAEPMHANGFGRDRVRRRVPELLDQVGLEPAHAGRYPHEFSGGQRQRLAIARALSVEPELLVLDEPVSALDVSVQAGVLNLLTRLQAELSLAYLFVSHDLSVIRHVADRVTVVYLGRTVETGAVADVFDHPVHPYTRALLSAVPIPDPARERDRERILLTGDPPSPTEKQHGCRFRSRCPVFAGLDDDERQRCIDIEPEPTVHGGDHTAACHYPDR
jgi:peptide/nickel transport system ATP-binding protein